MSQYRSSRDGSRAPPPVRPKPARQAEAIAASAVKWKIGVSRLGYYALSSTRSLPRCTLDCLTRDPPLLSLVDTADWPTTSCGVSKSCSKESMSDTLSARLPRHGKHCYPCRRPPPGSPPAWLRAPGLRWCKHREGRCGSRGRRPWPSSNPASKQRSPQRLIPARRTSRLATASAHPDDALHRPGQSPRRPIPVQQQGGRLWLPKELPRASTHRKAPPRRRSIRLHNPRPHRRAPS